MVEGTKKGPFKKGASRVYIGVRLGFYRVFMGFL